MAKRLEIT